MAGKRREKVSIRYGVLERQQDEKCGQQQPAIPLACRIRGGGQCKRQTDPPATALSQWFHDLSESVAKRSNSDLLISPGKSRLSVKTE